MSKAARSVLWVNGRRRSESEPAISALDRGFTLGDGVFETMLAQRGRLFRLSQHLARLRRGAELLELALGSETELVEALRQALEHMPEGRAIVRLTVTRGPDAGRGVALPESHAPTVAIRAVPAIPPADSVYETGYHAVMSSIRRNEGSPLARIKSCNYADAVLARREAQRRGADEAIMLNNRGEVACAATANIFIVRQGKVWTPPEECGVLPGVTRACVLELARAQGTPVEVAAFRSETLQQQAEEAFITNTALGLMPVTDIEGHAAGRGLPGPVTQRLAEAYATLVRAELGDAAAAS